MKLFKRELYLEKIRGFYQADDLIKVITGVRRCGKSSLMQTIAQELKESGISEENIIYIDLDKRGFKNIKEAAQLEELIEKSSSEKELKYLFIDEVQNVNGFEEVLNAFRTEGNWSIFITGSNSYLLSGEIMTKLTGRYIELEMFPLTFEEYEKMKVFYKKEIDSNIANEMNNYILEGGFPRAIFFDKLSDKRAYLSGIVQEIFEKDIRRRIKIRTKETFELVRTYIINNFGSTTSLNNLCEALKKGGNSIGKATVARYIKALLDAKILYECPRFDVKSKKSLSGEKKYYLADLGFYFSQNTDNRINYGPVLENIVYTYSRSHDYTVSVGKIGKFECDFILRDKTLQYSYLQIAMTILASKETEDREYRALETIRDNYPKYVLTLDSLLQKRNGIIHQNIAEFMKGGREF